MLPMLLGSMCDTNLREPGRQGARANVGTLAEAPAFLLGDH
ncbi:MAG TPA: hypothetical protein VI094_18065 [Propionibacteriaceae bacterium]